MNTEIGNIKVKEQFLYKLKRCKYRKIYTFVDALIIKNKLNPGNSIERRIIKDNARID